jgi:hypothetical protein
MDDTSGTFRRIAHRKNKTPRSTHSPNPKNGGVVFPELVALKAVFSNAVRDRRFHPLEKEESSGQH